MPGRRTINLIRRNAIYYFRGYVPRRLRATMQRRELRVSLRTHDRGQARLLALRLGIAFDSLCSNVTNMILASAPDQDIRHAVQDFGRALLAGAKPPRSFAGPDLDRDFDRAMFLAEEEEAVLKRAIADNSFDFEPPDVDPLPRTRLCAQQLAAQHNLDVGALPGPRAALLHLGVARAQLEETRLYLARLKDPFVRYAPRDPLFAVPSPTPAALPGPRLGAAIERYVEAKSGIAWTARTKEENRRILDLATQHFGEASPITSINIDHVRNFRDGLLTWRRKPPAGARLEEVTGAAPSQRIGAKTAAKYFGYVSAAFNHFVNEGYLEKSPVGKLSVPLPTSSKARARRPFSRDELKTLYGSPIFTGCAGPLRRTSPGPHRIHDGFYWLLLIAPLSGMRITEIVQLTLDDINFSDAIPAFRICANAAKGQSVKSDAGWRSVPVHRRLLELRIKEFVAERRANAAGRGRLLHDIHVSQTGGAGGEASKLFGRTLKRLGLKQGGLVFHSFRHAFIDQLREQGAPEYIIKQIVGHAGGSVTDGYGAGATLKARQHWLDKVDLLENLPAC